MKQIIAAALILTFLASNIVAQNNSSAPPAASGAEIPEGFKTDGCTLFPDGDYRDCCVAHDLAYFNGGTRAERWRADKLLYKCVKSKKGWWHKLIAPMMWTGVRVGGVSFLPTPFRWGYGRKKKPAAAPPKSKKVNEQKNN